MIKTYIKDSFKKLKEFLKKLFTKWWFYALLLLALSLGIPITINELYGLQQGYMTIWGAEEALSFYGSFLSFLGTVVLGAASVILSKQAIEQSEKANELAMQMQKMECAKFLSMVAINELYFSKQDKDRSNRFNPRYPDLEKIDLTAKGIESKRCYLIDAVIENNSDYPIVQIIAFPGEKGDATGMLYGIEKANTAIYIQPHRQQSIRFVVPCAEFEKYNSYGFRLSLGFVNVFDYVTQASIQFPNLENSNGEWYYRIAKVTDVIPRKE